VVPATARILAAYAAGLSTDLLTNTLLATRAPVVVCPAMHTEMWEHPAVQHNSRRSARAGVTSSSPRRATRRRATSAAAGSPHRTKIVARRAAARRARPRRLQVVVSAGGTREPIDAVRVIANRSSGKQGYAIARRRTHAAPR
jgi:phosphopantothenoylcysteine decarboxylase/phosphopantothenate--cysteine ligase